MGGGDVNRTLLRVTRKLDEIGVPYALAGAMALFRHGFQRFTDDVDLLVTRDGNRVIHERLVGLGFVPPFTGSKNLRDTETGVKVEFLIAGDYPGDGKPKPIAFPDPAAVAVEIDGVRCLPLPTLIELKLASGLSAPHRGKDLTDVQEVIRVVRLPRAFADRLHPDVRAKFLELWGLVPRRFVKVVPVAALDTQEVVALLAAGAERDPAADVRPDYAYLTTSDPAVAERFGLTAEADLWDRDDPGASDHV